MTTKYGKLVRDNIPDIIKTQGKTPVIRILSDEEYLACLKEKLVEEVGEFQADTCLEEFCDILEVLDAIKAHMGFSDVSIQDSKNSKRLKNGGFEKRLFLEEVTTNLTNY